MAKYRKKPVVVEAMQLSKRFPNECLRWLDRQNAAVRVERDELGDVLMVEVETLEGLMRAYPGHWIIRGVKGEFYPCDPDIFEQTYEAVEVRSGGPSTSADLPTCPACAEVVHDADCRLVGDGRPVDGGAEMTQ